METVDYYMTEEGQLELGEIIQKRDDSRTRSTSSLSILKYATQDVSSMDVDTRELVCIGLTADSGARDSVMPRKGPCDTMKIDLSVQSERGL